MKPDVYTSRQSLVNLYNKRMNLNLNPDDVDFSTPLRVEAGKPYNTLVTISPKTHVMAIGNCKVAYNRVHISRLGVIAVDKNVAVSMHDLLDEINAKYELNLTTEDIEDTLLDPLMDGVIVLTLQVKPTSVMYYSGTEIFTPTYPQSIANTPEINLPEAGTVISEYCYGEDRMVNKNDGLGGSYTELVLANSPECGFDPDATYVIIDGGTAETVFPIDDQIGGGGAELPV
jgi:hypothetical protein